MKLLQEFIRFTRYDAQTDEASPTDIVDTQEVGQGMWAQGKFGQDVGEFSDDVEAEVDVEPDQDARTDDENNVNSKDLDGIAQQATQDPDRAGLIRRVPNARLVYKRETADGSFEELWVYNIGNIKDEMAVRKAILAGTDIPTNQTESPDGSQNYTIWTSGNAEMLHILGLPQ